MRYIASLGGTDLPVMFSYNPYIPRKRKSVTATAGGVVTQYADTPIVHGDGILSWRMEGVFASEYQTMYNLYVTGGDLTFLGYWGETLTVAFDQLDPPVVRGKLFSLSGSFQVKAQIVAQNVSCSS